MRRFFSPSRSKRKPPPSRAELKAIDSFGRGELPMRRLVVIWSIAIAASVAIAAESGAQNPQAVLSWGSSCPTVIQNLNFGSPGQIAELWIGVKNLTAADANAGSDINLFYGPPVADAWR